MYKVEYLPSARQDMLDAVTYISRDLCSPQAAERLAEDLIKAADNLGLFPYANAVYIPIKALKYEYRKLLVKNYIIFYRVDETGKTVTVARVIYARRDYEGIL